MANIDVISLIFESFELMRAHYKEVMFPLVVLLLLSGGGHIGGSSFSDLFGSKGGSSTSQATAAPLANALSDPGGLSAGLMGVILIVVAIVVVLTFVLCTLEMSIWFYVSEHFQAILSKGKTAKEWKARMSAHLPRAFFMSLFEFALLGAFILAAAAIVLSYQSLGLAGAIALFALVVLAFLCISIFIIPAWIYYAIDRLPFFQSLSRSFSLVKGNLVHFLAFAIIFAMLGMGAGLASIAACCLSFIVAPIMAVFFGLLSRVTLLKMKNAMEPAANGAAGRRKAGKKRR